MQLAETHIVTRTSPMYGECERICFASKNIRNRSLYLIKEDWNGRRSYDVLNNLYYAMRDEDCFKSIPCNVAQQTVRMVQSEWKSFFNLLKAKKEGKLPEGTEVNEPKYQSKKNGRYVARYTTRVISKKVFKKAHKIKLSQVDIEFYTKVEDFNSIDCVSVVPEKDQYKIMVSYTVPDVEKLPSNRTYAGLDLGVKNLATVVTTKKGVAPFIISGGPLKSINQFYNKELAAEKQQLHETTGHRSSHKTRRLTNKRNNKVNDYMHKASKAVVDFLVRENITMLVIGKNDGWKQRSSMGARNNQNFQSIPHSRFVNMLKYKCERCGITVKTVDEAHTSKCSFMDLEEICHHDSYAGRRVKRGMFVSAQGVKINADVNAAYNIIRKAVPKQFSKGIDGLVVNRVSVVKVL